MDRKTAAKYIKDLDALPEAAKAPRTYVTRKTDFDKFWPEIQAMLENENRLKPYSILEHMIEKHKEDFDPKWQKTLERRISKKDKRERQKDKEKDKRTCTAFGRPRWFFITRTQLIRIGGSQTR